MPATKSTYSLDVDSVRRLQSLAARWQVSKTEVLRRALRQADEPPALTPEERIAALHSLQKSMRERGVDFDKWKKIIKDARR